MKIKKEIKEKTLVKKKIKKAPSSKKLNSIKVFSYSQSEVDDLVIDYIKGSFHELMFEVENQCPKDYEDNSHSNSYNDAEIVCDFYHEKEIEDENVVKIDHYILRSRQYYINDRLILFRQLYEASEPLEINFYAPEKIKEIMFLIDGRSVGGIKFENNLPTHFYTHEKDWQDDLNSDFEDAQDYLTEQKIFLDRLSTLYREKIKIQALLKKLCEKIKHPKSCIFHQKLLTWNYPISKKKIKKVLTPDIKDYLQYKNLWK